MKFIIRDDDTCAFTQVSEIEKCYKNILNKIPICLSITPFRIPGSFCYFKVDASVKEKKVPLDTNPELLAFLQEGINRGMLDIAMHGYSHIYYKERNGRIPEYCCDNDNLLTKTRIGKEYLENLFKYSVNTFVPPSNSICKKGMEAVIKNKMNLITNSPSLFRFSERPFNFYNLVNGIKKKGWEMRKKGKYPYVLNFHAHKEMGYYTLYPNSDMAILKKQLDFCHSVNGIFILSVHYHGFKKRIKSGETIEYALYSLIDHVVKKTTVEFVTYKEIW